jgi:hypothetical protein
MPDFQTLNTRTEGAVLFSEISCPPMNLLGTALVADLVMGRARALEVIASADDSMPGWLTLRLDQSGASRSGTRPARGRARTLDRALSARRAAYAQRASSRDHAGSRSGFPERLKTIR